MNQIWPGTALSMARQPHFWSVHETMDANTAKAVNNNYFNQ
jgi:hypothetical protein